MASILGKGFYIGKQAQEIILNVVNYFRGNPETSLDHVHLAASATGIGKAAVRRIRDDGISTPKARGRKPGKTNVGGVDSFDRAIIRRTIQSMYTNKTWPTLDKILAEVQPKINVQITRSTLHKVLKSMGYKYGKREGASRKILKERPDLVAKRHTFLSKVTKLRLTGRKFIYLDETWLNSNHTVSYCWIDSDSNGGMKVPSGGGNRLIILHAGSEDGFVPNGLLCFTSKNTTDYHEEMDGVKFRKWFEDQLLPNIPPNSVILMDNASYHSMTINKIPNISTKKKDIQEWLTARDIPFDPKMIKPQLIEIVKEVSYCYPTKYIIDEIAAAHGHEVLRIPPYHCEFNATELIWAQLKGAVARKNNQFNLTHVKALFEEEVQNITPENWSKAIQHTKKLEETVLNDELKIDSIMSDTELNSFRFYPYGDHNNDSDISDSESDSSSDSSWPSDDEDDDLIWIPTEEISEDEDDVPEFPQWRYGEQ